MFSFDEELAAVVPLIPTPEFSRLAEGRALAEALAAGLPEPVIPDGVTVSARAAPGLGAADPAVRLLVVAPARPGPGAPGLLHFHGGGFISGAAEDSLGFAARVAEELGAVVVSVEYRLAPEHPFPAATDDGVAALRWFAEQAGALGVDPGRIGVSGVSAGGGLAAAMTLLSRERGGPPLCFQLLQSPALDHRVATGSALALTDTPLWHRANAESSWRYYLGELPPGAVPAAASPALAADFAGLPPAYVSVNQFDPLRDEGLEYAGRLAAAGVPTEAHLAPGTFHCSEEVLPEAAVSRRSTRALLAALRRGLTAAAAGDASGGPS